VTASEVAPEDMAVKFHTFGDRVIHDMYMKLDCDATATSAYFCAEAAAMVPPKKGPNRKMIKKAYARHENGETEEYRKRQRILAAQPAGGRMPALDDEGIKFLKREAEELKQANAIIRPQQDACYEKIRQQRLLMCVRRGLATRVELLDAREYELTDRTMRSLAKLIWPEQRFVKKGTLRREEAKAEPRNAISVAAVAGSVFDRTHPDCIVTTDHLAMFIDSKSQLQLVFAAAGSQKEMRKQQLSMAAGPDSAPDGGGAAAAAVDAADVDEGPEGDCKMPVMCSMAMSGKVVSAVAEIWDDQLHADPDGKRVKIFALDPSEPGVFLSATTFVAYIAHGTPHELVMFEVYSKVVLPKAHIIRTRAQELAAAQRRGDTTGALGEAASVVPPWAGSLSSRTRSRYDLSSDSARSVQTQRRSSAPVDAAAAAPVAAIAVANPVQRPRVDPTEQPAPAPAPVAAPQRLSSNSNNGRRAVDSDDSDDDNDEEFLGTWTGDPAEFDLVVCMDGDSSPLAAFLDKEKMRSFKDDAHPHGRQTLQEIIDTNIWGVVALLKWAAACSMLQSPNDVGHCHPILRKFVKGRKGKKTFPLPLGQCGPGLKQQHAFLFHQDIKISAKRKRGFWRLLSNLPGAVLEAFRERVVKSSWRDCGYYPLRPLVILRKCSIWKKTPESGGFTDAEKQQIITGLPALKLIARSCGRVSDADMLTKFPFLSRYPTGLSRDLGDMPINRDRCVLVLHPRYFAERAAAGAAARALNPDLRAPPKRKAPKRGLADVVYELYSATASPRCTMDEIREQLSIRDVVVSSRVTKKDALLRLWEINSTLPDKRCAAARPRDARARRSSLSRSPIRPGGGAAAVAPIVASSARLVSPDRMRVLQALEPSTPPRTAPLTPRRQAALRAAGQPWLYGAGL
jgi:hypothetical protein